LPARAAAAEVAEHVGVEPQADRALAVGQGRTTAANEAVAFIDVGAAEELRRQLGCVVRVNPTLRASASLPSHGRISSK